MPIDKLLYNYYNTVVDICKMYILNINYINLIWSGEYEH